MSTIGDDIKRTAANVIEARPDERVPLKDIVNAVLDQYAADIGRGPESDFLRYCATVAVREAVNAYLSTTRYSRAARDRASRRQGGPGGRGGFRQRA